MIVMDDREELGRYDSPDPTFGGAASTVLGALEQWSHLEIHIVSCVRREMRMPTRLGESLFYHGLFVPKSGFLRTAYFPCIIKIRQLLRRIQPDIVHGQGTERYAALAASWSGFTNVITLHGIMKDSARVLKARPGSFHWLASRLETVALKRTSGVFCNSRYTQGVIAPRTRRTWLVPNAVREIFLTQPISARLPGPCLLLHVGVISENKQQLESLEMARSLWQQRHDFQLQFIGSVDGQSAYGRTFLERVNQAQAEGFACYLGSKSGENLIRCLDQASALIHTPIAESFGLVVAEALARNLKFFGFRVGGVPDIAEVAVGTVLVTADDWSGLAQAVSDWLNAGHPMPPPCADVMRQRYHPSIIARRHIDIYRQVLGEPH
jgi:glycosyltransferase involved in cell wall biosynthesis